MKKLISLILAIVMVLSVATLAVTAKEYDQPFTQYGEGYENIVEGSKTYRIPSLYTLDTGAVIAIADKRYAHGSDSPNNIDVLAAISADGYTNWEYNCINYLDDYADDVTDTSSASFIDSAVVQTSTGRIIVVSDACPTGGGYWQAMEGTGFVEVDGKKHLLLTDRDYADKLYTFQYYIGDYVDGMATVYKRNENTATEYSVDGEFRLYKNGEPLMMDQKVAEGAEPKKIQQNIFYRASELTCYLTTYLMMRYSDDGGKTWSTPELLSSQVKSEGEDFLGIGPGRGFVTTVNGKERIIFAVYDNVGNGPVVHNENVSTIYSDDNGVTWHRGAETKCRAMLTKTSEAQIVDLGNGKLRMYARNQSKYVAYADSTDGGHSWTKFRADLNLPSNGNCMVSFINAEIDGKQFVLGSYASNTKARADGVIKVGVVENGDINWVNTYYFGNGFYAYSCLTQLADGRIGILYEGKADEITYMIFDLDKDGNLNEINGNNIVGYDKAPVVMNSFLGFFYKIFAAFGLL